MIRLPTFTFLCGPAGSGKTTLSQLLMQQDSGMTIVSFAEPLREALLSIFHPEERFDNRVLNLRDERIKALPLPLAPNWTHRQFMIDLGQFLRSKTNEMFFGDLAKLTVEKFKEYYVRFVFDDARTIGDISPFVNGYGAENCILVRVERRGVVHKIGDVGSDDLLMKIPGITRLVVPNNEQPEKMIDFLLSALKGSTPSPKATPARPTIDQL